MGEVVPSKGNILIVDDTPDNLRLLSTMLTDQGYDVRSVINGAMALMGVRAEPPDLILLDINMPDMSGYEVCQHLKRDPKSHAIPVIFISALDDVLDKVNAFSAGGVDYITKPFHVEEVLARVETHLSLRRLQVQLQAQNQQLQQEMRDRDRAEQKFVKAYRLSPNPIAIASLHEGRLIDGNPAFLRMSGYGLDELVGATTAELQLGIRPEIYSSAVTTLLNQGVLHNQECEFRTKTGELKTVLISMELIDLDGVPCTLTVVNDITERKRLENEFISLVSHELRTPLTSILGSLDLLASGSLGHLSDRGSNILTIAVTNAERLLRLVNDILDLERMKSGKITLQPALCPVQPILVQAVEAMQALADQAQIELRVEAIDAIAWVDGDRLLQTLTNLLSNAIKFSEPGSTVWLSASRPEVNPFPQTVDLPSPYILFAVKDPGRGIPADNLNLIFERFHQVDASDARQKGGTGLGLAICRNIVEQHGGKIWVESVLGQGSTFYVALPGLLDQFRVNPSSREDQKHNH